MPRRAEHATFHISASGGLELKMDSCSSSKVKGDSKSCSNLFDGSLSRDMKGGACFLTNNKPRGWLVVKLKKKETVFQIVLLPTAKGGCIHGCLDLITFFPTYLFSLITINALQYCAGLFMVEMRTDKTCLYSKVLLLHFITFCETSKKH